MAQPRITTPAGLRGPVGAAPSAGTSPPSADGLPADLNGSWRNLMTALSAGLPHGLNRAVNVTRKMHRAVS